MSSQWQGSDISLTDIILLFSYKFCRIDMFELKFIMSVIEAEFGYLVMFVKLKVVGDEVK